MTVTQRLMGPGNIQGRLRDGAPVGVAQAAPVGSWIVIAAQTFDPSGMTDAAIFAQAAWTGIITKKPDVDQFEGFDLSWVFATPAGRGDLLDAAVGSGGAAWTLAQWWTALKPTSINTGTITPTGTNYTGSFQFISRREAWDTVCAACLAEWRINPNNTMDAGTPATLWPTNTTPTVMLSPLEAGYDGAIRGIQATGFSPAVDIEDYARTTIVVGSGSGGSMITAAAASAALFKDLNGNDMIMEEFVNSPTADATGAAATASSENAKRNSVRRQLSLTSQSPNAWQYAKPGDAQWAWDDKSGYLDVANAVVYRGDQVNPVKVRLFGLSWPITDGMGVFVRANATSTWIDLSDFWEFETGDTQWDVGAVPPIIASQTPANVTGPARLGANPQVLARAAQSPAIVATLPVAGMVRGDMVLNLADMKLYVYYGATTGWGAPWDQPRGFIGQSAGTNVTTVGATQLIGSATASLAMLSNRQYLAVLSENASFATVAGDSFQIGATQDASAVWFGSANIQVDVGGNYMATAANEFLFTTSTGNHTYSPTAVRLAGTGTFTMRASVAIYDVGPAGAAPAA